MVSFLGKQFSFSNVSNVNLNYVNHMGNWSHGISLGFTFDFLALFMFPSTLDLGSNQTPNSFIVFQLVLFVFNHDFHDFENKNGHFTLLSVTFLSLVCCCIVVVVLTTSCCSFVYSYVCQKIVFKIKKSENKIKFDDTFSFTLVSGGNATGLLSHNQMKT